jgi:hypothetical protein
MHKIKGYSFWDDTIKETVFNTRNHNNYMARGRNVGYGFLDGVITTILRESSKPLQPLGISFMINERARRLVGFNTVKQRLNFLVTRKKIFKGEIGEDDNKTVVYWSKPIH